MVKRILFVCTGNTCRSPLAEGLFRHLAKQQGLDVEARSAGVMATNGMPISAHSEQILKQKGIADALTSSSIDEEAVNWADLVLTMTVGHKKMVVQQYPHMTDKVYTLKEFVEDDPDETDIADPFGGPLELYEQCAAEIELLLVRLLQKIKSDS